MCPGTQRTGHAKSYNFETELPKVSVKTLIGLIVKRPRWKCDYLLLNLIQVLWFDLGLRRDYPLPYCIHALGLGGIIPHVYQIHASGLGFKQDYPLHMLCTNFGWLRLRARIRLRVNLGFGSHSDVTIFLVFWFSRSFYSKWLAVNLSMSLKGGAWFGLHFIPFLPHSDATIFQYQHLPPGFLTG